IPTPEGGEIRHEVGYPHCRERCEDRHERLQRPERHLRPVERPGARDPRGGEGLREVHEGRCSKAHRARRQRRCAFRAREHPRRDPGRDDLSAREPVRAVRDLLLEAGGSEDRLQGRPEDRPRLDDRQPEREPRGCDRGSDGGQVQRERPAPLGQPEALVKVAEAEAVWKSFGTTRALQDVSVSVEPGECHALVGRNGAGKSTLVGVLTGLLKPDRGTVRLHAEPAPGLGDRAAWQARVACVYQRSMVIPSLTVAENVFLNRAERPLVRWRAMRRGARRLMLEWGFDLDVDQFAADLSVEQKQIVEIARALSLGSRFLILDEPTASLEAHAITRLFERVRRLRASGVGILYISHHLEEIYEICDTATVLRDGKHVVTAPVAELDRDQLVAAMVGTALGR